MPAPRRPPPRPTGPAGSPGWREDAPGTVRRLPRPPAGRATGWCPASAPAPRPALPPDAPPPAIRELPPARPDARGRPRHDGGRPGPQLNLHPDHANRASADVVPALPRDHPPPGHNPRNGRARPAAAHGEPGPVPASGRARAPPGPRSRRCGTPKAPAARTPPAPADPGPRSAGSTMPRLRSPARKTVCTHPLGEGLPPQPASPRGRPGRSCTERSSPPHSCGATTPRPIRKPPPGRGRTVGAVPRAPGPLGEERTPAKLSTCPRLPNARPARVGVLRKTLNSPRSTR